MTAPERQLSFAEHVRELRARLMWALLFVVIGAGVGYALHDQLLAILQRPLHDMLYYTNPTGAFSFIIKICTVFGLLFALPVLIYHIFAFFGPLIKARTRRQFVGYVVASFLLAIAGITFAYFISLPAALNFLVNFGSDKGSIEALITANEYFNFVLAYIAGYAVLFQLPLIMSFINRVKPLTPKKLMGGSRYVILGSFIVAAIITPTPDPFNQLLMAGPIILLYFGTVFVITLKNIANRRKLRKFKDVVPHIEPRTIEAILDSLPPLNEPLSNLTFAPIVHKPLVNSIEQSNKTKNIPKVDGFVSSKQKFVNDMVPANRRTKYNASASGRRVMRRQIDIQPQPRPNTISPRMGVISDFIPAN